MKRENVNYLAVGVFVLTMLILFMVVLYRITGRGGPMDSYFVFLDNVAGLNQGTPVYYEGFKVGQVEDITPDRSTGQTRYRLEISLPSGWQIPADSVARAVSSGLLSAVTIDIQDSCRPLPSTSRKVRAKPTWRQETHSRVNRVRVS